MEILWQDIRYALRMMVKSPGFVAAAVLTLALGIGANSAIFSMVNGVLLRPLPYAHPEQIVSIYDVQPNYGNAPMSYPEYADWRDKVQVFQSVSAQRNGTFVLSGLGSPEQVRVICVSASYLPLLGVIPIIGRNILPEEEPFSGRRAAMISYSFWRTRLNGDPSVLTRALTLDDNLFPIVGVLPPDYQPLQRGDILIGLYLADKYMAQRGLHFLSVYGRLRPGLSIAEAQKQLVPLADQVMKERSTRHGISISSLKDDLTTGSGAPLMLMFVAVGFILLIGCANVANLLLARAAGRNREVALRIALGAGRWRIVRQLITESTLLSLVGAGLGLLIGRWTIAGLVETLGARLPRAGEIKMDVAVLLFTLGIAVVTGILFGLAPARTLLRNSLTASLGEGGRAGSGVGKRQRSILVTAEVALALVLMAGAGLVLRSFSNLLNVRKGFDADHVLTFYVNLTPVKYKTPVQQSEFFRQFRARLSALPGVESAGLISDLPLTGTGSNGTTDIEGRTFPEGAAPSSSKLIASPGYFRAMHIPLLRGRDFSDRDVQGAPPVMVINQAFADKYFPNEDPIGKHVAFSWGIDGFQEVIGVIGNVRHDSLASPENREIYVCYAQRPDSGFSIALRTKTDPGAMLSAVRSELSAMDPGLPIAHVSTLDDVVSTSVRDQRASVLLLGSLGGLALGLTAIGIYSVLAYSVAQQTREIGVRMALGAQRGDVLRMVLRKGLAHVVLGAVLGLAASLALTRLMSSLLFDVKPTDPLTLAGVTVLLLVVALAACWIPAMRATRVDPIVALRYE
jgi:putative ABC transport system permease protein